MTTQEKFKRRIRERMIKTGERYGAARRALLRPHGKPDSARRRRWAAEPTHPDDVILANTGHGWDDWVDLIDAGPGRDAGHPAIATWVREEHGISGWWAQGVTVGYERITGIRLPGQMLGGTFTVSKSKVVQLERGTLRAMLLDDRDDLFPGFETTLRSKESAKALRFGFERDGEPLGIVMFSLDPASGERLRVTVTHEKLDSLESGDHWKDFWGEWLSTVEEAAELS